MQPTLKKKSINSYPCTIFLCSDKFFWVYVSYDCLVYCCFKTFYSHRINGRTGAGGPFDIGLLKLKTPLVFNEFVKPIRLPRQGTETTGMAILSGWGIISPDPMLPYVLQYAPMRLMNHKLCYDNLKNLLGDHVDLRDTDICTFPGIPACSVSLMILIKYITFNADFIKKTSFHYFACLFVLTGWLW